MLLSVASPVFSQQMEFVLLMWKYRNSNVSLRYFFSSAVFVQLGVKEVHLASVVEPFLISRKLFSNKQTTEPKSACLKRRLNRCTICNITNILEANSLHSDEATSCVWQLNLSNETHLHIRIFWDF